MPIVTISEKKYATNYAVANATTGLQLTINHNQTIKNAAISSPKGVARGLKAGEWGLNEPHATPWQLSWLF